MLNLSQFYKTESYTSVEDQNYGLHVSEIAFFKHFSNSKESWKNEVIDINNLENIDFITRKYSVEINKEIHHPRKLEISVSKVTYERLTINLELELKIDGKKIARCSFELVAVDTIKRKIISKSYFYEEV